MITIYASGNPGLRALWSRPTPGTPRTAALPACPPSLRSGFRSAPARPPPSGGLPEDPYRPVNAALDTAPRRWNIARLLILGEPPSAMPTVRPVFPSPGSTHPCSNRRPRSRAGENARTNSSARTDEPSSLPRKRTRAPAHCRNGTNDFRPARTNPSLSPKPPNEPARPALHHAKNARTNSFPWDRPNPSRRPPRLPQPAQTNPGPRRNQPPATKRTQKPSRYQGLVISALCPRCARASDPARHLPHHPDDCHKIVTASSTPPARHGPMRGA